MIPNRTKDEVMASTRLARKDRMDCLPADAAHVSDNLGARRVGRVMLDTREPADAPVATANEEPTRH